MSASLTEKNKIKTLERAHRAQHRPVEPIQGRHRLRSTRRCRIHCRPAPPPRRAVAATPRRIRCRSTWIDVDLARGEDAGDGYEGKAEVSRITEEASAMDGETLVAVEVRGE